LIFACDCGRTVDLVRATPETAGLWAQAKGWRSPDGPCHRCNPDPVNKLQWSWSALQKFETCPKNSFATGVGKTYKEAPNPAMIRGNQIHKALENAIGRGHGLPEELHKWFPLVQALRASGAIPETKLGLSADLRRVDYWSSDIWLRVVIDVHTIKGSKVAAVDWKTGKHKEDAFDQLRLTAAALLLSSKELTEVENRFVWLDAGGNDRCIMDVRGALECMVAMRRRLAPLAEARTTNQYDARPCWQCRFCPVLECKHNRVGA
jgi:hypothetical protein